MMTYSRHLFVLTRNFVLGAISICALLLVAQTDSDGALTVAESELTDEFKILSELEAQSYQRERYLEIKDELKKSPFTPEHQDLLAQALSKNFIGMPVSSFRQESVSESMDSEPVEEVETIAILDTGLVKNDSFQSYSLDGAFTPFPHIPIMPLDPTDGRVLTETDSEITFRFDVDVETPDEEETPHFFDNLIRDLELVVDLTIDQKNRSMKTASFHLLKPIKQLFLFTFKNFKITYDYEYIDDCGCMAVRTKSAAMGGSLIFVGRFSMQESVTYSDIECEKPLRYLQLNKEPDNVITLMF